MVWRRYEEAPYYGDGFVCNECGVSERGYRWICVQCNDDYCGRCRPRPVGGATNDHDGHDGGGVESYDAGLDGVDSTDSQDEVEADEEPDAGDVTEDY